MYCFSRLEEKATINPKNKDDKCFQYATTVALNQKEIKFPLKRVSSIEPFINKYNWNGTKYPLFKQNNTTIPLNVFISKKWKNVLIIFQKSTQTVKNEQLS